MNKFDDIELEDLLEFIETGGGKMPPELLEYAQMLEKIWGMIRRRLDFPSETSIIKYLMAVHGFQRHQARKLIRDTESYFSAEFCRPKDVWRNVIAELMLKDYSFSISVQKTSSDADKSDKILERLAKVLQLDVEDMKENTDDWIRSVQILSTDISMFGEIPENRNEVARQIDALPDVSENVKERVKMDMDYFPFKLLKTYAEEAEQSKAQPINPEEDVL